MTEQKYNIGNGHEISVEYDEHNITKITRECFEALIEKQIPKNTILVTRSGGIIKFYPCPSCSTSEKYVSVYPSMKFCHNCGQALKWGNENDRAD